MPHYTCGYVRNHLGRSPEGYDPEFRSPLLRLGRFGLEESKPSAEVAAFPRSYRRAHSITRSTVQPDLVETALALGWHEFLGEPIGARLHARVLLFGMARLFQASEAVMSHDQVPPLASAIDGEGSLEEAPARLGSPRPGPPPHA